MDKHQDEKKKKTSAPNPPKNQSVPSQKKQPTKENSDQGAQPLISTNPDDYKDLTNLSHLNDKTHLSEPPSPVSSSGEQSGPPPKKETVHSLSASSSPFDMDEEDESGMWGKPLITKKEDISSDLETEKSGKKELKEKSAPIKKKAATETNSSPSEEKPLFVSPKEAVNKARETLTSSLQPQAEKNQSSEVKEEDKTEGLMVAKNPPKSGQNPFIYLGLAAGLVILVITIFFFFRKKPVSQSTTPPSQAVPVKKNISLTYWGLWEPASVMQPLFAKFEKETGIKVNYLQKDPHTYRLTLEDAIKNGEGPDVFRFHNTWTAMLKGELATPPDTVFDLASYSQTFYPIARKDLVVANRIKGVPLEIDGLLLFYNKDLLKKANLLDKLPTNWDLLARQAQQLTQKDDKGKITTAGVALGTTTNVDHWSDILGLMFYQNGVKMDELATSIDNKGRNLAADAIRYYTHFVTGESPTWSPDLPSSTVMFDSGRLAYYFGPSWRAFEFSKNGINFGITNVPKIPGDDSEWATYWALGVSASSKHQKEAWQLVKFLTQKENLKLFFQSAKQLRLFGEPYPRLDMNQEMLKNPYLAPLAKVANNFKSYYFASFTYDKGINDRNIDYLGQVINQVLTNNQNPEDLLTTTQKQINTVLNNYQAVTPKQE